MKGKFKYKAKRKRVIKVWYVVILLVIVLLAISTSYSLFSTNLTITSNIQLNKEDPELPIEVSGTGETTSDGGTRYSTNTNMSFWGIYELYSVVSDEYTDNSVTTTIKQTNKAPLSFMTSSATFTLTIENNTGEDFTNGKVDLVDSSDKNSCFSKAKGTVSPSTISSGSTATVTITGTINGSKSPATNTYYKFAVTYIVNGSARYFYYIIKFTT